MGFVCDQCHRSVKLNGRACPYCGKEYTVQAAFASLFRKLGARWSQPLLVNCPECRRAVPASAVQCPFCRADLTVEAAFDRAVAPAKDRWEEFADNIGPRTRGRIWWAYFFLSCFLLWEALGYVEKHHADRWLLHAALSVVYLGFMLLLFAWLMPRDKLQAFARRAPARVALAVVANYLTLLLLLQIAIGTWWTRATILAGLFAVTFAGMKLFTDCLRTGFLRFLELLFTKPETATTVDPSAAQGRSGRVG